MSITLGRREFSAVVLADFEFTARSGERSVPICAVFHDLVSDCTVRLTAEEMRKRAAPPVLHGTGRAMGRLLLPRGVGLLSRARLDDPLFHP